MQKRGQLTIFIIVAVVVVAMVAIIFLVSPELRTGLGGAAESPENFIQTCLEDVIKEDVDMLSLQGGSLEPEFYYLYQDHKLQYLCYSSEYYELCTVQVPFLRTHIEGEIKESIEDDVEFCFDLLEENYKDSTLTRGDMKVEILPQRILTTINNEFVFTKAGETERRESFRVVLNNNLYELVAIAQNIIEWENIYGSVNPDTYMDLYRDLKVEKYDQIDETTVYILTNKDTEDKFQFVSRSLAFSPLD